MSLSDFFHPLGLSDLIVVGMFLLIWDIIGTSLIRQLNPPEFSRAFHWVIGLSFFSFFWWIIRNLIEFNSYLIILLALFLSLIFFRGYLKERRIFTLFSSVKSNWLIFISLLPLLPILYVKLSLPPLSGDEVGYHYYAPYQITTSFKDIQIRDDLYAFIPQSLNNIYRILFALTKSYSASRLTHLLIVISGLSTAAYWLKKNINILAWIVWSVFSIYLITDFTLSATSGMIDMATAVTVLVFIFLILDFSTNLNASNIFMSLVVAGVGVGFKYTSLIPLFSFTLALLILRPISIYKTLTTHRNKFLYSLILLAVCGGYWLIFNFFKWGNPIYPLGGFNSFFSGWTIPINKENISQIFTQILYNNYKLKVLFLLTTPILLISIIKYSIVRVLLIGLVIEVVIAKLLSGFWLRYYLHWTYIIFLLTLIPTLLVFSKRFKLFQFIYTFILILILLPQASAMINVNYYPSPQNQFEKKYANNEINISDWLKEKNPKTYSIIESCGRPANKKSTVLVFDPDLMYYAAFGQPLEYLVNCIPYKINLAKDNSLIISKLKNNPVETSTIISIHECMPQSNVSSILHIPSDGFGDEIKNYPHSLTQRLLNNEIVCNSKRIDKFHYEIQNHKVILIHDNYKLQ